MTIIELISRLIKDGQVETAKIVAEQIEDKNVESKH